MDFELSDDQRLLKDNARNVLEAEWPTAKVRQLMDHPTGVEAGSWQQMGELGWLGMRIPEVYGGSGLTMTSLVPLAEEFGRALVSGPFTASAVTAAAMLRSAGGELASRLLSDIAAGRSIVVPALDEPASEHAEGDVLTQAVAMQGQYQLSGTKLFVPHADVAEHLIVSARTSRWGGPYAGISLFVVPYHAEGVSLTPLHTVDATWRLFEVSLDKVRVAPSTLLGALDGALPLLETARRETCLMHSAEATGVAERALEMATAYAKERVTFGHPIASYQAIQHKLVDMLVEVENARSLVYYAAWALDDNHSEAAQAVAMAKAYSADIAWNVTTNAIQVYGGIGFTWECDLHLYHRRALQLHASHGSPAEHRETIARLVIGF
jgi:alkylation response protein AidB-like acyl-CoA dehydrogenase